MAKNDSIAAQEEKFRAKSNTALVFGYSGATGSQLVKELAERKIYSKVKLVGRREIEYEDEERQNMEQIIIDFDKLDKNQEIFQGVDHVFCCLGTTIRQAKTPARYIKVHKDYILLVAKMAKLAGCSQFHLQSCSNADRRRKIPNFKIKGQVEFQIALLQFEKTFYYRCGVLLNPKRDHHRPIEALARAVMSGISRFSKKGSISVENAARTMVNTALIGGDNTISVVTNRDMKTIGNSESIRTIQECLGRRNTMQRQFASKRAVSQSMPSIPLRVDCDPLSVEKIT